ncbi:MAG TPA: 16S rRNA (cytosine(1402)-N(4))-methyltransferase RsmH, partial [Burkholderiales bacterium]|nr:16S rRNA (cytosine(1402)-N(4))-methyltransferase RsmH [Burkholderiales bacterium]
MSALEHRPVLLRETLEALRIKPDGVYVDCTFGRGGHSRAILAALGPGGMLLALDRDPDAMAAAAAWADPRFRIRHAHFAQLSEVAREAGLRAVDGILMDLGVSSPQLDDARRGFSFRLEGPLDMRMDTSTGMTAAQWLATATEHE